MSIAEVAPMPAEPLPDVRTLLSRLPAWHFRLPEYRAAPVEGRAVTCDAVLYGTLGYADETLFLYGYNVGEDEHCFLYDTPWDETHRAYARGQPPEWYDGLQMPRAFQVRHAVAEPSRHEILDPLLKVMMERPLRYLGTRPAIPRLLAAGAAEVLGDIQEWDARLRFLRRGRYLLSAGAPEASGWTPVEARFGGLAGSGNTTYAHYHYDVGATGYVFAVKCQPPLARMTPSDHAPQTSRKERRAHLALARRQEEGFRLLTPGQPLQVRFNPADPGEHALGTLDLAPSTAAYQLEPVVLPRSK
ncbi:hypothetical protein BHS05_08200 [Myxococcus xanthus]|nr:hypothetical protein BHS05_08200 [Myxococcus xanthus]